MLSLFYTTKNKAYAATPSASSTSISRTSTTSWPPRRHPPPHSRRYISNLLPTPPQSTHSIRPLSPTNSLLKELPLHQPCVIAFGEHNAVVTHPPLQPPIPNTPRHVHIDQPLGISAHAAYNGRVARG